MHYNVNHPFPENLKIRKKYVESNQYYLLVVDRRRVKNQHASHDSPNELCYK